MHGTHFHYRRYFPNNSWLGAYRDRQFDFWADSERLDHAAREAIKRGIGPKDKEDNPLWIAGSYEIEESELVESFSPDIGGGYVWTSRFSIMNDRIIGPATQMNPMTLLFKPAPVRDFPKIENASGTRGIRSWRGSAKPNQR